MGYWVKKLEAARPVDLGVVEAAAVVELVEVNFSRPVESVPGPRTLPLRVAIGERFRIEVAGDFEAAVFEKLALSLVLISDRLA